MRHLWILTLFLSVPAQSDLAKLDAELRRRVLDPAAAAQSLRAIVRLNPGAPAPPVPGVTYGARLGDVVSVRTTPAGLLALSARAEISRIERDRRFYPKGNLSQASTIGVRGSLSEETDTYSFSATAGIAATIRVHAEAASLDTQVTVTDAGGSGDDNGPGTDAEVTVTWATTGIKSIAVSSTSGTGGYVLFLTQNGSTTTGDLTGGDIGPSNPVFDAGTGAREARASFGLDGAGVVIGIVDTGIDFTHNDFRDAAGGTRLLAIWDQTLNPDSDEASPDVGFDGSSANDYGVEYSETQINGHLTGATPGYVRQEDSDGHGTHVAGIAAGDDATFPGAAPGARLIAIKTNFVESEIIDAVNYVFGKATQLGVEAVVLNLSLGTHDGPHDGTSALDQAIDAVSARGRYVVVSAGNEGDPAAAAVHAQADVSPSGSATWTFTATVTAPTDPHIIDVWAHGSDEYTVTVTQVANSAVILQATSGTTATFAFVAGTNGWNNEVLTIDNKVDAPSNGATHIRIQILDVALNAYTIQFTRTLNGGSGIVDGYVGGASGKFASIDAPTLSDGAAAGTISEPGTATRAITVGAYRTLFAWDSAVPGTTRKGDGIGSGVPGQIALFSSRGPTRDGRTKPDVGAPGAYLGSTRSADATYSNADVDADTLHVYREGSSMAAPAVSGVLALLLQRNRVLTPEEILQRISSTARQDGLVTAAPASSFGSGKIDAAALVGSVPVQKDVAAASRCLTSVVSAPLSPWPLALAALLFLGIRRRRALLGVALFFACALPASAQWDDEWDLHYFARARAGLWMSGRFEFSAVRLDGDRKVDSRGMGLAGLDTGIRWGNFSLFATLEGAQSGDLSATMAGGGISYTVEIKEDWGRWAPVEVEVYFGAFWARLEIDQDDFGDFDDTVGVRAGANIAWRPLDNLYVDLFVEYRQATFRYRDPIIDGDDEIGGPGVAFGLGLELRL